MASYSPRRWLVPLVAGALTLLPQCEKKRDYGMAAEHIAIDPYVSDSVRRAAKDDGLFLDGTAYVSRGRADSVRISVLDVNLQPDSAAIKKYGRFMEEAAGKACGGKPDGKYDFHFGVNSVLDHEKSVGNQ